MDSYVRRKRWEYHEQAVSLLNVQAEAMSSARGRSRGGTGPPAPSGRTFRTNHGGVNHGPPPLGLLQGMGLGE